MLGSVSGFETPRPPVPALRFAAPLLAGRSRVFPELRPPGGGGGKAAEGVRERERRSSVAARDMKPRMQMSLGRLAAATACKAARSCC